jgi:hypothetical protein
MNNVQQANVQQAIRDAAEKGGYRYRWWKVNDLGHTEGYNGLQLRALPEHFCDPDFWKALATARKWEDVMPRAFTGTASSTTLQMEKMLRVFSPLYEKQMLTSSGNLSGSCKPGSA